MMSRRPAWQRAVEWVLVSLTLAAGEGCQQSNLPHVVPVTGTVRYQGQPLEGATLVFSIQHGKLASGELAYGTTDAQGRFTLSTHVAGKTTLAGACLGEHRVTISKFIPPNGLSEEAYRQKQQEYDQLTASQGFLGAQAAAVPPKVESLPPQYSDSQQTTLSASVQPKGKNDFTFDLK
jgi:hypothetical protein